ncbi:unnamed protein product [Rhizophagus irregularis]|nr:unnamed protein product [Rhizophagus irregularis]
MITTEEWDLLQNLVDVLEQFAEATDYLGVEVCSGEIRSIRHPIRSKNGSSGLRMNGLRIIRMDLLDNIGLIGCYTDDRIDRIDQIIWSNS